jgi:hypothetical protein
MKGPICRGGSPTPSTSRLELFLQAVPRDAVALRGLLEMRASSGT